MKHFVDKYAKCPFYGKEAPLKVYCEGYCEGNNIQLSFATKELMKEHKNRYCNDIHGYRKCPLYHVVMKKYEEDGYEQVQKPPYQNQ